MQNVSCYEEASEFVISTPEGGFFSMAFKYIVELRGVFGVLHVGETPVA